MSTPATGGGATPQTADDIAADIEQTRHNLGQTVEALTARADIKAQFQQRATQVIGRLRGNARVYGATAAAVLSAAVLSWLAVRRRRH